MENYNKKSIWKWIALYLLIATVAYGLVYYFFFNKNENNSYSLENNQNQVQNNSETANWKTYRNNEHGFEVKYPNYANFNDDPFCINEPCFFIDLTSNQTKKISVATYDGDFQPDCSKDNFHLLKNPVPVEINSVVFIKGDVSDYYSGATTKNYADQYCTKHKDYTVTLTSLLNYSENPNISRSDLENDEDINKIISTFKFTK